QVYVSGLRGAFVEALEDGAACGCSKTAATCRDVIAHERKLWAFVGREGVEPTNNVAERALRHAVLWRKGSGGTDSSRGSRFVERVLLTVEQRSKVSHPYIGVWIPSRSTVSTPGSGGVCRPGA